MALETASVWGLEDDFWEDALEVLMLRVSHFGVSVFASFPRVEDVSFTQTLEMKPCSWLRMCLKALEQAERRSAAAPESEPRGSELVGGSRPHDVGR